MVQFFFFSKWTFLKYFKKDKKEKKQKSENKLMKRITKQKKGSEKKKQRKKRYVPEGRWAGPCGATLRVSSCKRSHRAINWGAPIPRVTRELDRSAYPSDAC